jgi:hypothetical protein
MIFEANMFGAILMFLAKQIIPNKKKSLPK